MIMNDTGLLPGETDVYLFDTAGSGETAEQS
jgi:hypothetical protein